LINNSIEIGKYLVSPLTKRLEDGRYAASVSIRSGRGSGTHDRVMRFVAPFATRQAAIRYAIDQGLAWIGASAVPGASPALQAH
jgi:hypothetical protein